MEIRARRRRASSQNSPTASLARPGGNTTGLTQSSPELAGKRLQLLREAVPNLSRLALLVDPDHPEVRQRIQVTEAAAATLGVLLHVVEARTERDLGTAFASMKRANAGAVFYEGSTRHYTHRVRIAEHALSSHLPSMCGLREYVEAGGLMGYGARWIDLWHRAAYFVDRIVKGAKPADLPVEGPTNFDLVVNLKTARALQLAIPPSVLLQASHVIE